MQHSSIKVYYPDALQIYGCGVWQEIYSAICLAFWLENKLLYKKSCSASWLDEWKRSKNGKEQAIFLQIILIWE